MRWTTQLAILGALAAAGGGSWYGYDHLRGPTPSVAQAPAGGPPGGGAPAVEVAPVRTGRMVEVKEAVGTARADESIVVTAKQSGIVARIGFHEGETVKAGDVLIQLDDGERRAELEQVVALIGQAVAQRDEVRQRLDRAVQLRRSGATTEARIDELEAQVRSAENNIKALEARKRASEARLDDLRIAAPFAGRVGVRNVSVGALVAPGDRVTTLDDIRRLRVDFSVPENLLGRLAVDQPVSVGTAAFGTREFVGKVAVIDTRVDPVNRSVKLSALVDNADEALRPGMFLNVRLSVSTRDDAVLVPEEALVGDGLRHVVFVVGPNNVIDRRFVRIGARAPGQVEIVEGLKAGEIIVVRGVQRVRPGQTVNPRPVTS